MYSILDKVSMVNDGMYYIAKPYEDRGIQGTDDRHLGMCSLDILGRCCRNWLCYMYLCLEVLLG